MITCKCGKQVEKSEAELGLFCSEECFLEAAEGCEDALVDAGECTCPDVPTGTEYRICPACQEYEAMLDRAMDAQEHRAADY